AVDGFDFQQREIPLPLLRRPNLAGNGVAGLQLETFDLRRRYIDVVRTIEIIPILTPQKAVSLGKNLQHALTGQHDVLIEQLLLDTENEILLAESRRVLDLEPLGHFHEL